MYSYIQHEISSLVMFNKFLLKMGIEGFFFFACIFVYISVFHCISFFKILGIGAGEMAVPGSIPGTHPVIQTLQVQF